MNKLSENKIKMIIISSILLICLIFIFILIKINEDNKYTTEETIVFNAVEDYNTYYFIQKNINNFLNYLSNSSKDNVYNLLNKNFIEENSLSLENSLYDKELANTKTTYNIRIESLKTYQLDKNNNIILYDLTGDIYDNGYDLYKNVGSRRFILLVDYYKKTFNVYPIIKTISNKDIVMKLKTDIGIENNNYNDLETVSVITENMMCMTYYYDLHNLILNDKEKAVKIIQNIDSIKKLEKIIEDNNFFVNISSCKTDGKIGEKIYHIIDINGNKYTFKENGIMNYTVSIVN